MGQHRSPRARAPWPQKSSPATRSTSRRARASATCRSASSRCSKSSARSSASRASCCSTKRPRRSARAEVEWLAGSGRAAAARWQDRAFHLAPLGRGRAFLQPRRRAAQRRTDGGGRHRRLVGSRGRAADDRARIAQSDSFPPKQPRQGRGVALPPMR